MDVVILVSYDIILWYKVVSFFLCEAYDFIDTDPIEFPILRKLYLCPGVVLDYFFICMYCDGFVLFSNSLIPNPSNTGP